VDDGHTGGGVGLMATYNPLAEVMPVASMVTNAIVTAALCDQMRDNLVALYDGWWFRASKSTATTTAAAVATPFDLDTIVVSQTAEDEGAVTLTGGDVIVNKTGLWIVGGHYTTTTTDTITIAVSVTGSPAAYVCESCADNANTKTDLCASGAVEVTTVPATMSLVYYTNVSLSVAANTRSPFLWGYRAGDLP